MHAGRKSASFALDGVFSGFVFAFVQMLDAAVSKLPALFPFQAAASTVLGRKAIVSSSGLTIGVGLAVHLVVSACLGLLYHRQREKGVLSRTLTSSGQLRPSVAGLGFGLVSWAFVTVLAYIAYPWLVGTTDSVYSWWMLTVFFGWPLGVLAARTERRQPVELKIVYSAESTHATAPLTPPPSPSRRDRDSASPPPRASRPAMGKGWRKPSSLTAQKRASLRLLVKSGDNGPSGHGHDGER